MWKFIQRGLRETFERGLNLGRNDVRVNRETKKTTYCGTSSIRALTVGDFHCNRRQNCRQGHNNWNDGANGRKYRESYGTQDSFDRLLSAFSCVSNKSKFIISIFHSTSKHLDIFTLFQVSKEKSLKLNFLVHVVRLDIVLSTEII